MKVSYQEVMVINQIKILIDVLSPFDTIVCKTTGKLMIPEEDFKALQHDLLYCLASRPVNLPLCSAVAQRIAALECNQCQICTHKQQ